MKKRYIITLIVILILIISATLIQRFYIDPKYRNIFITHKIINPINGFVVYKNDHRTFTIHLSKFDTDSVYNKYAHISEMEAFRKPQIDNYIFSILKVNFDLYDKAEIGNRIEKLVHFPKLGLLIIPIYLQSYSF
ncbi:MAG: hypothetical protein Q4G63_09025 [Bacteroidia bacterium]|nr:hypothetical protein [Bacteroidia bacterium]